MIIQIQGLKQTFSNKKVVRESQHSSKFHATHDGIYKTIWLSCSFTPERWNTETSKCCTKKSVKYLQCILSKWLRGRAILPVLNVNGEKKMHYDVSAKCVTEFAVVNMPFHNTRPAPSAKLGTGGFTFLLHISYLNRYLHLNQFASSKGEQLAQYGNGKNYSSSNGYLRMAQKSKSISKDSHGNIPSLIGLKSIFTAQYKKVLGCYGQFAHSLQLYTGNYSTLLDSCPNGNCCFFFPFLFLLSSTTSSPFTCVRPSSCDPTRD